MRARYTIEKVLHQWDEASHSTQKEANTESLKELQNCYMQAQKRTDWLVRDYSRLILVILGLEKRNGYRDFLLKHSRSFMLRVLFYVYFEGDKTPNRRKRLRNACKKRSVDPWSLEETIVPNHKLDGPIYATVIII